MNSKTADTSRDIQRLGVVNGLTAVRIVRPGDPFTALLDAAGPRGITVDGIDGFTGSYGQRPQGNARLSAVDETFTLAGEAVASVPLALTAGQRTASQSM